MDGAYVFKIFDQYLLFSTNEENQKAPYVRKINEMAGNICNELMDGCTKEDLVQHIERIYDTDGIDTETEIETFLLTLKENGYIEKK